MDITSESLIDLFKLLGSWVAEIANKLGVKKRENIEALSSVQDALTVTRSYIASLNRKNQRDYDKEKALSLLWNSASNGLYKVGQYELAQKCSLKGYYWASPDSWKDSDYPDAEIEVDKVFNDVQNILNKLKKNKKNT
jgi:hypothetical protein